MEPFFPPVAHLVCIMHAHTDTRPVQLYKRYRPATFNVGPTQCFINLNPAVDARCGICNNNVYVDVIASP